MRRVVCRMIISTSVGTWYSVGLAPNNEHSFYATSASMHDGAYGHLVVVDFSHIPYVIEYREKTIPVAD